ncbi:hypothetical protein L9F63_012423, partial [Diploptera punctata]
EKGYELEHLESEQQEKKSKENRSADGNQSAGDGHVMVNGISNGYTEKHSKKEHKSEHKDKHRDKDRHKERSKDHKDREKDKDKEKHRDKEKHGSSGKVKSRERGNAKSKEGESHREKKEKTPEPEPEQEAEFANVTIKEEHQDFLDEGEEEEENVTVNSYTDLSSFIKSEPSLDIKSEEEETEDDVPLHCSISDHRHHPQLSIFSRLSIFSFAGCNHLSHKHAIFNSLLHRLINIPLNFLLCN